MFTHRILYRTVPLPPSSKEIVIFIAMAFLRDCSLYCISNITFTEGQRHAIGGICMASSSIGFLGAALQLKSLWKYRNRRRRWPSAHPRIIFYLALCDLFASLGMYLCFKNIS